ncbi:hypothetical protein [Cognatiluteimonas profundi]|uniref:hypothetical protein n=1 Tax=Cognatiluteimonas profundi TaxID=2594501 RepID=UPI00131D43AC|nr:hypothetical protein [Lysobacter profundi]
MRHQTLMLGIIGCISAPLACAQDRDAATASGAGDTQSHAAVAKSHKPLSPIGRAMADLLRAAAQAPAPKDADAAPPKAGPAATDTIAAAKPAQADQVAVH